MGVKEWVLGKRREEQGEVVRVLGEKMEDLKEVVEVEGAVAAIVGRR